jgi:hypothetical protein
MSHRIGSLWNVCLMVVCCAMGGWRVEGSIGKRKDASALKMEVDVVDISTWSQERLDREYEQGLTDKRVIKKPLLALRGKTMRIPDKGVTNNFHFLPPSTIALRTEFAKGYGCKQFRVLLSIVGGGLSKGGLDSAAHAHSLSSCLVSSLAIHLLCADATWPHEAHL